MRNAYSKDSEYQHLYGPPCNEDYGIIVEVTAATRDLVTAKKVWDEGSRVFYAKNCLNFVPEIGSLVLFRRAGEFASPGNAGYELRTQDASKSSWACIAPRHVCLVQDIGSDENGRKGREIYYDANKQIVVIDANESTLIRASDPAGRYHANTPPWATGRVYAAVKENGDYQAILPGYGDYCKTIGVEWSGKTLEIDLDSQGNVCGETGSGFRIFGNLWKWDVAAADWETDETTGSPPCSRYGHFQFCNISDNLTLYIGGGINSFTGEVLFDFYKYRISTKIWTKLNDLPWGARYDMAYTKVHETTNKATVGGGINANGDFCKDFWQYDSATDTWTQLTDADNNFYRNCLTSANSIRYLSQQQAPMSTMQLYNFSTGLWETFVPTTSTVVDTTDFAGHYGGSASTGIWVCGGRKNDGNISQQFYTLLTQGILRYYYKYSDMPVQRYYHSMGARGTNDFIVFGGIDENGNICSDTYRANTGGSPVWSNLAPGTTPEARYGCTISRYFGSTAHCYMFGGKAKI